MGCAVKIGNLKIQIPIIQGGMALKISKARLAASVANEGGVGVIAATGMTINELKKEIRRAKEMTRGIIGVNALFAIKDFANLIQTAIAEKVDLIISGAGISRDIYKWGKEGKVPILPIVSSERLGKMAEKFGAQGLIVEGVEAGGHLGTDKSWKEILPQLKNKVSLPLFAAGGIIDALDIKEALSLGATGVQMGTRFACSEESDASLAFKQRCLLATESEIIASPVGLPGRAVINEFVSKLKQGKKPVIEQCSSCLKSCFKNYCIKDALLNATADGDIAEAVIFAGSGVSKIKEILSVQEIFRELKLAFCS